MKTDIFRKLFYMMLAVCLVWVATPVQAKVSEAEAQRLKNDLTPFGAERAGNVEGTIPAWEGGLISIPENVTWDPASDEPRPNPFADEKPLYIITAQDVAKYDKVLTPGLKEMFKKYPDTFQMHVYPTHRTAAAPQWVYDNTYKNALNAEVVNEYSLINAYGGIAFPIPNLEAPEAGQQMVFNHATNWKGGSHTFSTHSYRIYEHTKIMGSKSNQWWSFPYYYEDGSLDTWNTFYGAVLEAMTDPAALKGQLLVVHSPLDYTKDDDKAWQYLPGQRRVRRAPNVAYDTPRPQGAGLTTYDDVLNFNGSCDRYNFKFLEKKEMLIPYNNYDLDLADVDDMLSVHHVNPKVLRWELHRVWVVEASLKENKRHVYGKRVFHLDEDTWVNVIQDKYDTRGNLWRIQLQPMIMCYDVPAPHPRTEIHYDFQVSHYYMGFLINGAETGIKFKKVSDDLFTPAYIRRAGLR